MTLLEQIDAALARPVRPPVYVEIVDPSGRVSYRRWSDHPDVLEALGTQGYTVRRCPQQPDLEGEVHPDRALLVEARAQLAAQAEAGEVWVLEQFGSEDDVEGTWYFAAQDIALASIPAVIISSGTVESVTQDAAESDEYVAAVRLPNPPAEMVEHFRAKGYPHDGRGGVLHYRFRVSPGSFPQLHTSPLLGARQ